MNTDIKNKHSYFEQIEDFCTILLYLSFILFSTNSFGIFYMMGLVAIIYLLHSMSKQFSISFHKGLFHRYVFFIALFCLLSSIWAQQSSYAIEKGITLLGLLVVFSLLYEVYYNSPERLLTCLMWAGFILSIYTIMFVGVDSLTDTIEDESRLESSFANVNVIGMCCSTSVLLTLYFWKIKKKIINILLCVPTIFVIAGSGSRKALVLLVLGVILIILLQSNNNKRQISSGKKFLGFFGSFIVLGVVLYVIGKTGLFGGTLSRMDGMIASITGEGNTDSSSLQRAHYRLLGFQQFLETPILGMGMGNPRLLALQYTGRDCYLHCNYAEVAAGGGIVGLILIYWIYLKIWKAEYKARKRDRYAILMLILILLNLILDYGYVSYYSKNNMFVVLILCIHYETIKKKELSYVK